MNRLARVTASACLAVIAGAGLPGSAQACSCAFQPLPEIFARADTVVWVVLEPSYIEENEGGRAEEYWPIRSAEFFKGQLQVDRLTSNHRSSCNAGFEPGAGYLVFTTANGEASICGIRPLGDNPALHPYTLALLAYRDKEISEPTEPWLFRRNDEVCTLGHQLDLGGSRLSFEYRFRTAARMTNRQFIYSESTRPAGHFEADKPHPALFAGHLELRVTYPYAGYAIEGTGYVKVGDMSWFTSRKPMVRGGRYEVLDGTLAWEVLAALENGAAVETRATLHGLESRWIENFRDYPNAVSRTPATFLGNSVEQFRNCVQLDNEKQQ